MAEKKCLFDRLVYTDKSGISEFYVVEEATGARIAARGYLHEMKVGMRLLLVGVTPPGDDGFVSYESAHTVIGTEEEAVLTLSCAERVSEKIARSIVQELGADVYSYLDYPDIFKKLLSVPGVGAYKADAVIRFLETQVSSNDDYVWLMGKGFCYTSAMQLIREHGRGTKDAVLAEPYEPLYKRRADFYLCDSVARENGEDIWSERRVHAIMQTVLEANTEEGNTRICMKDFVKRCVKTSLWNGGTAVPDEIISLYAYDWPACEVEIVDGVEWVYPKRLKQAEDSIAADIGRLCQSAVRLRLPEPEDFAQIEKQTGVTYNTEQRGAFRMFADGGLIILTGDPGTGKTTTVDGLIRYFLEIQPDAEILLCAPTGRAASRISEISGRNGLTMHKAMKLTPYDTAVRATKELEYDFIVVDEMSMCDVELFAYFLSSVKSGTTVLLTGDPDQLPSVGPGRVFRDLIDSGRLPVYRLKELVRQEEASGIVKNARAALAGEPVREYPDFRIILTPDDSALGEEAVLQAGQFSGLPLLLSPVKKGSGGTYALNRKMQGTFRKTEDSVHINGIRYYVGDPVIMTHNNYKYHYYNGETGVLTKIFNGSVTISLPGRYLTLDISDAADVALSYSVTIHRSQGTESGGCVVVLPEEAAHMASGELLNTAFTRAKDRVVLVTTEKALSRYTTSARAKPRECGLLQKIAKKEET